MALDVASTSERRRVATADVFEGRTAKATARFVESGLDDATARQLSPSFIGLLEGTFGLCRASRTTGALEAAGATAAEAVRAALDRA